MLRHARTRAAAVVLIGLAMTVPHGNPGSAPRGIETAPAQQARSVHATPVLGTANNTTDAPPVVLFAPSEQLGSTLSATQLRHLSFLRQLPGAHDTFLMRVNADLAQAQTLQLDLSAGRSWLGVRRPMDLNTPTTKAWYGDLVDGGYALFVQHGNFLHGIVQAGDATFKVSPISDGLCAVQRVTGPPEDAAHCVLDEPPRIEAYDNFGTPEARAPTTDAETRRRPRNETALAPDPIVIIDVLVAYESTVAGLVPDIVGHIEFLTAWANVSYLNSRIHTAAGPCWQREQCIMPQIRIVVTTPLECPLCADATLSNWFLNHNYASKGDGWFDEVHDVRDEFAADVCVLLTTIDRPHSSGVAMAGSPDAKSAFCLVETPFSLLYPYIFAHEIGHLQGAGHFATGGDRLYARAWCHNPPGGDPADRFSTIMCTQSLVRVPFWSNPEIEYEPTPGHVFPIGDATHNNARRLNETSLTVASHRGGIVTPVRVADFAARAVRDGVQLTWRLPATALDELEGVHVQRADHTAGPYHDRTAAPLPPAQEMSWVDAQAPPGRASWYRLKLVASNGAPEVVGPVQVSAAPWTNALQVPELDAGEIIVRYSIGPQAAHVRLDVYDVRGRIVRVLEQRLHRAGAFEVRWDRRDQASRPVARGVYVLQLTAGSRTMSRKLLLLE